MPRLLHQLLLLDRLHQLDQLLLMPRLLHQLGQLNLLHQLNP
jgi:hypothetical protein